MKNELEIRYVFKHKIKNNISNVYRDLNKSEIQEYIDNGYELLGKEQFCIRKGWQTILK
jgi:hypothetical protein